jgi:hypothetical protein
MLSQNIIPAARFIIPALAVLVQREDPGGIGEGDYVLFHDAEGEMSS